MAYKLEFLFVPNLFIINTNLQKILHINILLQSISFYFLFLAVTTIEDRLSVDVEIDLCYCDKDECNADRPSHATFLTFDVTLYLCTFIVILQMSFI